MNNPDTFGAEDLQSLQTTVERFAKQAIAPARARDLHGIDEPTREELFLH